MKFSLSYSYGMGLENLFSLYLPHCGITDYPLQHTHYEKKLYCTHSKQAFFFLHFLYLSQIWELVEILNIAADVK